MGDVVVDSSHFGKGWVSVGRLGIRVSGGKCGWEEGDGSKRREMGVRVGGFECEERNVKKVKVGDESWW